MKKIFTVLCLATISASSALSSELSCTNINGQDSIKRSIICAQDLQHCVLSVKMENSAAHNMLLNKMISATRATITLTSSQQPNLLVTLTHRSGGLIYGRVSLNGIAIAGCR